MGALMQWRVAAMRLRREWLRRHIIGRRAVRNTYDMSATATLCNLTDGNCIDCGTGIGIDCPVD